MNRSDRPGLLGTGGVLPRYITGTVAEYAQAHQQTAPQDFFLVFDTACRRLADRQYAMQSAAADLPLTRLMQTLLPEPALCYPAAAQVWSGNTRLRSLSRTASVFFACRTEFQYAPPVRMPYHPPAGTGNRLGGGAMLGAHCYLRAAHLHVQVFAEPLQSRDHWQPGGEYHHYLGQFIRTVFRRPLTFAVIFRTDDTRMMPVQLAAMTSRLGRNTRL
ncbi:type VI secretion system baseplate subunit TssG [Morganella morganii]|uniref:type VI secretion system baseplate subunit TssG n=1 Tax=Morganella morganii TaxID=582 RepID=UPI00164BC06B|nr:type VI secretion system baseplate subunit TssG [Morganella morganii]MBC4010254.1 type VI secretion system baseplate subunit TssG [Morganella morganii]